MTVPVYNLPYGVVVESNGDSWPKIRGTHPMAANTSGLKLPDAGGPCRVVASWSGANACETHLYRAGKFLMVLDKISAGGSRSSRMVTVGAVPGDFIRLNVASTAGETGTIEIYPLPT